MILQCNNLGYDMKILYVTARWDPKDPDSGAGVNYNAFMALKGWADQIQIAGPYNIKLTLFERFIEKAASIFTKKRLIKFYPSYLRNSNAMVQALVDEYKPDVIFSKSSVPLSNVRISTPFIYMCDSTVKWVTENWPIFTKLGLKVMKRWERKTIKKASHIISFSQANADILQTYYNIPSRKITVHPIPSSLPHDDDNFQPKPIGSGYPLRLLLVGKEYHRKGVDVAIEATQQLNAAGISTELRIVGQDNENSNHVCFMGLYKKKDPVQLKKYMDNYRWAHFLLFPSRFDAAGIVPSEAAGFGVPTITNAAGGLATTVKDGVSGEVLPKDSPAQSYANRLEFYWNHPKEYQSLCESTYKRYQVELTWDALGNRLQQIILNVLRETSN